MKEQNPGKSVFITGGAAGIGEASVRKFAAEGWKVTFMDIDREKATLLPPNMAATSFLKKATPAAAWT